MLKIRVAWRTFAFIVWTLFMWTIRVMAMVLVPISRRAEVAVRGFLLHVWARVASAIIGMTVTVSGRPPKPPYMLVTNHLTNLDIIVLSLTAGCTFVSRADVAGWPLLGLIAKTMNTVFIDRAKARDTKRVNELMQGLLDKGYGVHFFAEGGISQDATVHPFKPSLLETAASRNLPVYYAAISYKTPDGCRPASEVVVWRDPLTLAQNMADVFRLPRLSATIRFGEQPIAGTDRKQLADELYQAVRARFDTMV